MTDFIVQNHGSIWLFQPVSEQAKELAQNDMGLEDWQWLGKSFSVDHRPAHALVQQLQDEGYEVQLG